MPRPPRADCSTSGRMTPNKPRAMRDPRHRNLVLDRSGLVGAFALEVDLRLDGQNSGRSEPRISRSSVLATTEVHDPVADLDREKLLPYGVPKPSRH
eukprot:3289141-Pyramimonas_sp.AAC.1